MVLLQVRTCAYALAGTNTYEQPVAYGQQDVHE